MRRHIVIPDLQIKPDVPLDHLTWIGKYIIEKQPDVVVQIGDFADFHSLSSYDKGKASFEGRRYVADLEAANKGLEKLEAPLKEYNDRKRRNKEKLYRPRKVVTLGNHEYRAVRAGEDAPEFQGLVGTDGLEFKSYGWEVYDFLDVVTIDGIAYSHYFINPGNGRPIGGMIETRIKNIGFSFTQGHQQGLKTGMVAFNNGDIRRGIIAGTGYLHDEDYLGVQANNYFRGILVKNEVSNGNYDLTEVSYNFLCRKYEGVSLAEYMREKYPETAEAMAVVKFAA